MRPNADIPWSIHGQIKQYAEANDITVEDAYIEALDAGTDHLPIPESSEQPTFEEAGERMGFGPRMIPTSGEESSDINDITTCFPNIFHQDQLLVTSTRKRDMSASNFRSCLAALQESGHIHDDWFTIHQIGGAWVGRGASNLARALEDIRGLHGNADFELYREAVLVYIADFPRDSEYLIIRGEIPKSGQGVRRVEMTFLMDGYPMGGREYYRTASTFGFSELVNAREKSLPSAGCRFDEPIDIEVVDHVVRTDENQEEPWVGGVIVENPFRKHPNLVDHLEWGNNAFSLSREAKQTLDVLQNYDTLFCELDHHHPISDEEEYRLEAVSVKYLSELIVRNSAWNIELHVDW